MLLVFSVAEGNPHPALLETALRLLSELYAPASRGIGDSTAGGHCAVTGEKVPLEALRYWSAERQEPYASAEIATRRLMGEA